MIGVHRVPPEGVAYRLTAEPARSGTVPLPAERPAPSAGIIPSSMDARAIATRRSSSRNSQESFHRASGDGPMACRVSSAWHASVARNRLK